jgi:Flp pilus assembly protein TadD
MELNENNENHDATEPVDAAGVDAGTADAEGAEESGGRSWLLVVLVIVLFAYPAARWMMGRAPASSTAPANAPASNPNAAASAAALNQSLAHYQAGRYQEAIESARAALAVDPKSASAWNNIAVSFMGLKKVDDAFEAAKEAVQLDPNMQLAKNNLAWIAQEKAKASLPPLPPGAAEKAATLINQSLQQTQNKQYKECVETAGEATRLNPLSATAFNNLGFCQALTGAWDDGIKSEQRALELDPNMQLAKNNMAWMNQEKAKAKK